MCMIKKSMSLQLTWPLASHNTVPKQTFGFTEAEEKSSARKGGGEDHFLGSHVLSKRAKDLAESFCRIIIRFFICLEGGRK